MAYATSYITGYSATLSTDRALLWSPKGYRRDNTKRGVVILRGAASGATDPNTGFLTGASQTDLARIALAITSLDLPMISPQMGVSGSASQDNFTNSTALNIVTDAVTYLTGTMGAKTDKVLMVAHSMGAGQAMAYARANPSKVSAMIVLQPLSDIQDVVSNDRGGFAASINVRFSGGYSDATYGSVSNPALFGASLAGIPIQFWYSTDDTIVIPSTVTALMSLIGSSAVTGGTGTGGHTGGLSAFGTADMLTFLAGYL